MSDAILPPELLQVIFKTAITLSEGTSVTINLIRVSGVVKEWMEPTLYQSVAILDSETAARFCSSIQSRQEHDLSTSFLASHVKEFTLNWDIDDALISPILEACTGIQSLYITRLSQGRKDHTCIDSVERAISSLRPKHIALDGVNDAHFLSTLPTATHIWLSMDHPEDLRCCQVPFLEDPTFHETFPSLTHIIVPMRSTSYHNAESNVGHSSMAAGICVGILSDCPALKVLVILPYPYLVNTLAVDKSWRVDWVRQVADPRCIHLLPGTDSNDPQSGFVDGDLLPSVVPTLLRTNMEIWEVAEREVALRQSEGRVIPPEYMVYRGHDCLIV